MTRSLDRDVLFCDSTENNESGHLISLVYCGRKAHIAIWMKEEGSIAKNSDEQTRSKVTTELYLILIFMLNYLLFYVRGKVYNFSLFVFRALFPWFHMSKYNGALIFDSLKVFIFPSKFQIKIIKMVHQHKFNFQRFNRNSYSQTGVSKYSGKFRCKCCQINTIWGTFKDLLWKLIQ